MAEHFCIAIEDTDIVLGCRGGADLFVSKYNGGERQHWKWTEKGCLENRYSRKVISRFKNGLLKQATLRLDCNNNESYQKWCLVDLKLRNQCDEYMYMTDDSKKVYLTKKADSCQLKWLFIPIGKINAYELYLQNPNSMIKAIFLKEVILDHLSCIVGCSIEEFRSTLAEFDVTTNQYVEKLTKVSKDVGIAKVTGGSTAIVGGILALIGLGLAPVTAGVSLGLTIAGTTASAAGGVTSLGGFFTSIVYKVLERKKARDVMEKTIRYVTVLHSFVSELSVQIAKGLKFSETADAIKYTTWLTSIIRTSICTAGVCRTIDTGVDFVKALTELKMIVTIAKVDVQATRSAAVLAEKVAASGLRIPFKGKVLLRAGTNGAKALSGIISVAVILFGMYDIYDGVNNIKGQSTDLNNLRSSITEYKDLGAKLAGAYSELANDAQTSSATEASLLF